MLERRSALPVIVTGTFLFCVPVGRITLRDFGSDDVRLPPERREIRFSEKRNSLTSTGRCGFLLRRCANFSLRKTEYMLNARLSRLGKRGVSRTSRHARRDAVDATMLLDVRRHADGKDVQAWRPDAGAKS